MPPIPKPEPRSRIKRRKQREEAAVIRQVRAACVERDGYCALRGWGWVGLCNGPSEMAHLPSHRRSKTRGMAPEARHVVNGAVMLCRTHHAMLDAHDAEVETAVDSVVASWR